MIDLGLLRDSAKQTIALIKKKDPSFDAEILHSLDGAIRQIRVDVEGLRQKKNDLARQGKAGVTDQLREESIEVGKQLKGKEVELQALEKKFHALYLSCPNLPQSDVPEGNKESNKVVKEVGKKPTFAFPIKNHL